TEVKRAEVLLMRARILAETISETSNALAKRGLPIATSGVTNHNGSFWILRVISDSVQKGAVRYRELPKPLREAAKRSFAVFRRNVKTELRTMGAVGRHPSLGSYVIKPNPSIETALFRADGSLAASISPVIIEYSGQAKSTLRALPKLIPK